MSRHTISIDGRAFKAEPDGVFIILRSQLRGQDLRALPSGTTIAVRDSRSHRSDPVRVSTVHTTVGSGFEVQFDYWQCPRCWSHALDYSKFMDAALELLKQAVATGITYRDSIDAESGMHHLLHMVRPEHKIEDIEAALEAEIDRILDPLMQFTIQLDQQVRQQFNV